MSPVSIKDLAGARSLWEFYTVPALADGTAVRELHAERVLQLLADPRARYLEMVEEKEGAYAIVRVEGLCQDGLGVFYYRFRANELDAEQKWRLLRHAQRFHTTHSTHGRARLARLSKGVGMTQEAQKGARSGT